eukprot:gene10866-3484_t
MEKKLLTQCDPKSQKYYLDLSKCFIDNNDLRVHYRIFKLFEDKTGIPIIVFLSFKSQDLYDLVLPPYYYVENQAPMHSDLKYSFDMEDGLAENYVVTELTEEVMKWNDFCKRIWFKEFSKKKTYQ